VYLGLVLLPLPTRLLIVAFLTAGPILHADNLPATDTGYKTVTIKTGGRSIPFRVQQQADPFKDVSTANSSGKYDPEHIFSSTSSLANKQFVPTSASVSQGNSDFTDRDRNTFVTKPYAGNTSSLADRTTPNLGTKVFTPAASEASTGSSRFDKTFATPPTDPTQGKSTYLASAGSSADQNRAADLGPGKTDVYAAAIADKPYLGPGAQNLPDGMTPKENVVVSRMAGLPDRPLTIDEVRNLINHETTPDTDAKPEAPSKPLNDPDYQAQPLRDSPSPAARDDDKDDAVPPPGTMAAPPAPENSEPLPQR
jgi:hypothetical protein